MSAVRTTRLAPTLLSVTLLCLVVGTYAVFLNQRLYRHRQPIYDSMSYYSKLHRVMSTSRYEGLRQAAAQAVQGSNTVALPFLVGALLGGLVDPSRAVGVWFQLGELWLLAVVLAWYFQTTQQLSGRAALAVTAPFLGLACLYHEHGGLSDFRMDLGLALFYIAACVCYLIARESQRPRDFWLLGLIAGAGMLCRATAPVYMVIGLAPIALVDIVRSADRMRLAMLGARAAAAAAAMALWFYFVNFDYLHYYYVEWNTDANARLPLSSSIRHLEFALKHIGAPAGLWLLTVAAITAWPASPRNANPAAIRRPPAKWDWRPLWIGSAPLILLVASGAGHNPFVCMPAALGLFLAAVPPLAARLAGDAASRRIAAVQVASAACLIAAAWRGYDRHGPGDVDSMGAHRTIVRAMLNDAHRRGIAAASYGALHIDQMDATSLQNVLLFDTPEAATQVARTICAGVQLMPNLTFFRPAEADWREIPGDSTPAKVTWLVERAEETLDYLVMPEPNSIEQISRVLPHFVINRHLAALRRQLCDRGQFVPVSEPVVNGALETVRLWRNVGRNDTVRNGAHRARAATDSAAGQVGGGQVGGASTLVR